MVTHPQLQRTKAFRSVELVVFRADRAPPTPLTWDSATESFGMYASRSLAMPSAGQSQKPGSLSRWNTRAICPADYKGPVRIIATPDHIGVKRTRKLAQNSAQVISIPNHSYIPYRVSSEHPATESDYCLLSLTAAPALRGAGTTDVPLRHRSRLPGTYKIPASALTAAHPVGRTLLCGSVP